MNRRTINANRRTMAEFCGFEPSLIDAESAHSNPLTGAAPNGTLPSVSDCGSVTAIGLVARFVPLRLHAANSLASLSISAPVAPCVDSKTNQRAIDAFDAGRLRRASA